MTYLSFPLKEEDREACLLTWASFDTESSPRDPRPLSSSLQAPPPPMSSLDPSDTALRWRRRSPMDESCGADRVPVGAKAKALSASKSVIRNRLRPPLVGLAGPVAGV